MKNWGILAVIGLVLAIIGHGAEGLMIVTMLGVLALVVGAVGCIVIAISRSVRADRA